MQETMKVIGLFNFKGNYKSNYNNYNNQMRNQYVRQGETISEYDNTNNCDEGNVHIVLTINPYSSFLIRLNHYFII